MKNTSHKLFQKFLGPLSMYFRKRRMAHFNEFIERIGGRPRVLDLGGTPLIWDFVPGSLEVTIVNLPGTVTPALRRHPSRHRFTFVDGDACDMPQFADGSFDLVFSNSVIEHVGGPASRARFATEARRCGDALWIQTPSIYFPVDPHTGMPFWWWYGDALRGRFMTRWERTLPAWTQMVRETTVVRRTELETLFPDSAIMTERFLGLPKSYVVTRERNEGVGRGRLASAAAE